MVKICVFSLPIAAIPFQKKSLYAFLNSFIVLMLHEVPEAEVQDWVVQLQKKSLSFITEQLPQKVKMGKSNLQSLFRSCRKIVRNSAGKHRKLLWGNEKKARLLLVHLQYQKQACFFSLSGRKNDVNSYPTNQETPSPLIYLHPDFTDSISLHLCSAFCRDRYVQQGIIAFH